MKLSEFLVAPRVLLSLLDRSRTRSGYPDSAALTHSLERAIHADALGYHRFWVAEHHAVPGIASGSPAVLLAAIGAHTRDIRLGSGGVMLPNHQPLVVAEQFLMLEAQYPGRIDLGLGRSLGFTEPVRQALRRSKDAPDTFATDALELRRYLEGTAVVTARPASPGRVPIFVLATRTGLKVAAQLGLPVVVGGPLLGIGTAGRVKALEEYRRAFQATDAYPDPYVVVSLEVMVADTTEAARDLLIPEAYAIAESSRTGEFPPLASPDEIRGAALGDRTTRRIDSFLASALYGTAIEVKEHLNDLAERTGADELLASTSTFDRAALEHSDQLLREVI
ncbi:MsnO8 family LLM class oxidoreductase [Rhodococcus sp. KBS0724]|uniref:MsnO8 family LLM class oxidoreductase n=1 Tax=Rhodococcus sp. KBS0724 TaxID=1179674 RepID=UPI00110EB2E3|nr:MsnO8 family LLM class oxidoreductase [Rhodococcus sp. KBS0724]TSD48500.1 MsnO8 family LLM class oxidoreductase [Rhodococcus sp. KBS0724]